MKKIVIFIVGFCLLSLTGDLMGNSEETNGNSEPESTQILCTGELTDLTQAWVNQYLEENPASDINVIQKEKSSLNMNEGTFAIVSGNTTHSYTSTVWRVMIGKKVLVPIISANNPLKDKINTQGVDLDAFHKLLATAQLNWSQLKISDNLPIELFYTGEATSEKLFRSLSGKVEVVTSNIKHIETEEIQATLQANPNAIVLCYLTDIIDTEDFSFIEGIQVLPFDRNGNGELDYMENVYTSSSDFNRAVYLGKYPKCFCDNIYLVANHKPENKEQLAFIEWVLTKGQDNLNQYGFSNLVSRESQVGLAMLNDEQVKTMVAGTESNFPIIWIAIGVVVVLSIIIALVLRTRGVSQKPALNVEKIQSRSINDTSIAAPEGLYYDKTHTWAFRERNGDICVGIDDFFQHLTGPITSVMLKNEGESINKGEELLTVARDGKKLTIYSPVSGIIKTQNEILSKTPETINLSPFSNGWVYFIEPTNWEREMQFLKVADKYKSWIKDEFARLKDFFAAYLNPAEMNGALAYQDGGIVKDGVLAEMEPKVWEDFQTHYINTSR